MYVILNVMHKLWLITCFFFISLVSWRRVVGQYLRSSFLNIKKYSDNELRHSHTRIHGYITNTTNAQLFLANISLIYFHMWEIQVYIIMRRKYWLLSLHSMITQHMLFYLLSVYSIFHWDAAITTIFSEYQTVFIEFCVRHNVVQQMLWRVFKWYNWRKI